MTLLSYNQQILAKALELIAENSEVTVTELSHAMHLQTYKEHKRMLDGLSELFKAKSLSRIRQGVYGRPQEQKQEDKRVVMWRILRMRRRVAVDDLVEMADVAPDYAKEWLRMLVQRGVVRKHQQPGMKGTWQLINDTVDMPEDDTKADRLRALRKKKKEAAVSVIDGALKQLQTIGEALSKARDAITTMEEGE